MFSGIAIRPSPSTVESSTANASIASLSATAQARQKHGKSDWRNPHRPAPPNSPSAHFPLLLQAAAPMGHANERHSALKRPLSSDGTVGPRSGCPRLPAWLEQAHASSMITNYTSGWPIPAHEGEMKRSTELIDHTKKSKEQAITGEPITTRRAPSVSPSGALALLARLCRLVQTDAQVDFV
jgi:hypothetical protein